MRYFMKQYYRITKIAPFISTANVGDYIIFDYCDKVFSEIFGDYLGISIPSREKLSRAGAQAILASDYTFVCGTNLLSSDMMRYKQWEIDLKTRFRIASAGIAKKNMYRLDLLRTNLLKFHVILIGAGWWNYQTPPTIYTRKVLNGLLDKKFIHSVRDSYTEKMLRGIGIHNVINTSCPTMWRLTEEFCSSIPHQKQDIVVTTITDYRKDIERDRSMIELLLSSYKAVFLWLQSYEDIAYLEALGYSHQVQIIPPTLKCYDEFLAKNNVDYIGTRLHGGIRALNHKKRACIIGVDNRAVEIAKDTNLSVVRNDDIDHRLREWIYAEQPVSIKIPLSNISKWKSQFSRGNPND